MLGTSVMQSCRVCKSRNLFGTLPRCSPCTISWQGSALQRMVCSASPGQCPLESLSLARVLRWTPPVPHDTLHDDQEDHDDHSQVDEADAEAEADDEDEGDTAVKEVLVFRSLSSFSGTLKCLTTCSQVST